MSERRKYDPEFVGGGNDRSGDRKSSAEGPGNAASVPAPRGAG